jgi:hypothetical protein
VSLFWLGPATRVDVWTGWWSCTSGVFPKVARSGSSAIVGRTGLVVDGELGYQWVLAMVLRLGSSIGSVSSAAASGLFSSLEYGGRQMLG